MAKICALIQRGCAPIIPHGGRVGRCMSLQKSRWGALTFDSNTENIPQSLQALCTGLVLTAIQTSEVFWCLRVLGNLNSLEIPRGKKEEGKGGSWTEADGNTPHGADIYKEGFTGIAVGEGSVSRWQLPQIYALFELSWQTFFFPVGTGYKRLSISIQHPNCAGEMWGVWACSHLKSHITHISSWRNITYNHGPGVRACCSTFMLCSQALLMVSQTARTQYKNGKKKNG